MTIVMLRLEEEEQDLRQFTVTCYSKTHTGLYASNELANFILPLPAVIELKDYWVRLQSIVYPPYMWEHLNPFTLSVNGRVSYYSMLDLEGRH